MATSDASQVSKSYALKELYDRYGKNFAKDASDDRIFALVYTTEELDDLAVLKNAIDGYVANSRYEFITGVRNLDSDWDAYIKELKGLNLDRMNEIINEAYDRMK